MNAARRQPHAALLNLGTAPCPAHRLLPALGASRASSALPYTLGCFTDGLGLRLIRLELFSLLPIALHRVPGSTRHCYFKVCALLLFPPFQVEASGEMVLAGAGIMKTCAQCVAAAEEDHAML